MVSEAGEIRHRVAVRACKGTLGCHASQAAGPHEDKGAPGAQCDPHPTPNLGFDDDDATPPGLPGSLQGHEQALKGLGQWPVWVQPPDSLGRSGPIPLWVPDQLCSSRWHGGARSSWDTPGKRWGQLQSPTSLVMPAVPLPPVACAGAHIEGGGPGGPAWLEAGVRTWAVSPPDTRCSVHLVCWPQDTSCQV